MTNRIKFCITAFAATVLLSACEKNLLEGNRVYALFPDNGKAAVKFYHAYGSKQPSLTTIGPNLFLYMGGNKLNGGAYTYATNQGTWPAPSTSATNTLTLYSMVDPGAQSFLGVMARVVGGVPAPNPGDTVFKANLNVEPGKYYTAVLSDTLPNPSVTLLEDNFLPVAAGSFKLRLANFAAWPNDVYDVYSLREKRIIASGVRYKSASDFVTLPTQAMADTFSIIKRSGNSPFADTIGKVNGLRGQSARAYTIFTRGKTATTSTSFQNFSLHLITQW